MKKIFGLVISVGIGIYLFIAELILIYNLWGIIGIILGVFLFPILLFVMPFYALFAYGNWWLLALSIVDVLIQFIVLKDD